MTKKNSIKNEDLDVLNKVVDALCGKFVFGYYDLEDIKQEARIMGLEAYENYDETKGKLYTFFYTHIQNRLLTLRRDKHYRVPPKMLSEDSDRYQKWLERNAAKQNLSQPSYIEEMNYDADDNNKYCGYVWDKDTIEFIQNNLPIDLLSDFRRVLDGCSISKSKYSNLINAIKEILNV